MNKPIQKISYKGGYFHIYNRGNRKQNIFIEKEDYLNYLKKIREYKDKYNISIVCYCLMPNHFHLLLRQDSDAPLYRFMHAMHTSYSIYFNKKYNKVGRMFQSRFKQKEIDKDEYLSRITSYIHFNPVKDDLVKELNDYQILTLSEKISKWKYLQIYNINKWGMIELQQCSLQRELSYK